MVRLRKIFQVRFSKIAFDKSQNIAFSGVNNLVIMGDVLAVTNSKNLCENEIDLQNVSKASTYSSNSLAQTKIIKKKKTILKPNTNITSKKKRSIALWFNMCCN